LDSALHLPKYRHFSVPISGKIIDPPSTWTLDFFAKIYQVIEALGFISKCSTWNILIGPNRPPFRSLR
jgi:hypothetical protein